MMRLKTMNKKNMFFLLAFISVLTTIYIGYPIKKIKLNSGNVTTNPCPNGTILYTVNGGNTGNKIWEYLSVLAVYKLYPEKRFLPFIPDGILERLGEIFEPLSLPPMSKLPVKCRNLKKRKIIRNSDGYHVIKELPITTKAVQIFAYSARYRDVVKYGLDKVRKELRYKPANIKIAMETLNELKAKFSTHSAVPPVYVGMHFRGTDYTPFLKMLYHKHFKGPPTHEFYSRAMKYFTDKYEHVIFILISIDYEWIKENAKQLKGNLAVNPYRNNKVQDMALLSHCNHSIINYGTFGVTVAMLAGGTTIVYDLKFPPNKGTLSTGYAKVVDNWIIMD